MKKQIIITIVLLMTFIADVNAVEKYVTDDTWVYLRRGPSTEYGFAGTVKTGEKVTVLERDKSNKYSKIQYANGRTGWIETSDLNDEPGLKNKVPELEAQLAEYKKRVDNSGESQQSVVDEYVLKLKAAEQKIADVTEQRDELQKLVDDQNDKIDNMSVVVDERQQRVVLKWFLYGGGIAIVSLLAGLILPAILTTRRRKNWMN